MVVSDSLPVSLQKGYRQMNNVEIVEKTFSLIPDIRMFHNRKNGIYGLFDKIITDYFSNYAYEIIHIEPFKGMKWPRISMGNLDSFDFFSMAEAVLYSFYYINRNRYRIAFDIGGNIGIDSIILSRFGYDVYTFEPDVENFNQLVINMELNRCENIHLFNKGISDERGTKKFIRVMGNTTANHIAGERNYYGESETSEIEVMRFEDIGVLPDLIKINVEGHEKVIVKNIPEPVWRTSDAFIEIHNQENMEEVFNYFKGFSVNIFSQKTGWQKVKTMSDMPDSNKEGYVFISSKEDMPW